MKILDALRLALLPISLAGLSLPAPAMDMRLPISPLPAGFGHGSPRGITVVITSSLEYETRFHERAPTMDFSREWLVYYSPGMVPSTGFEASIVDVRPGADGLSLNIITGLVEPGPNCDVKPVRSHPFALASFPRPVRTADSVLFSHLRIVGDCADPAANRRSLRRLAMLLLHPAPAAPAFTAHKTSAHGITL